MPGRGTNHPVKEFLAGGTGGACLVAAGHPLDTIKVRLQTMPKPRPGEPPLYRGMWDCALRTFKFEGLRGFYKGMLTPLLANTPQTSVLFFLFGIGKRFQQDEKGSELTYVQILQAGMMAGMGSVTIMAPCDRVKCLLQVQSDARVRLYAGPLDCIRQLLRTGGIRSLYRGSGATLLRDIPGIGVFFTSYEWIQRSLTPADQNREDLGVGRTLVAGGMAGVFYWIVSIVPDVLKSRIQTAPDGVYPRGMRDVLPHLIREDGYSALYRGFVPVMLRAFPVNAVCFLGYEAAMSLMNYLVPPA